MIVYYYVETLVVVVPFTEDTATGFIVPHEKGGYVISLGRRIVALDWDTQEVTTLAEIEEIEGVDNRLNDGKCDPSGRLWTGEWGKVEDVYSWENNVVLETIWLSYFTLIYVYIYIIKEVTSVHFCDLFDNRYTIVNGSPWITIFCPSGVNQQCSHKWRSYK